MSVALAKRFQFARALRVRPFALLWTGQAISALGDGANITALAWQVLVLTGSGTAMGVVLVAQSVPRVIFLLVGGVIADRLPRRLVMLWSDAGRAVAVLAVAALGWAHLLQLWHLIALSLLFGFASAFFIPAYQSIPPQLVERADLPSANALTGLSRQLSMLIGPALGAALVAATGPASAFALDGATFIVSAMCLLFLRVPAIPTAAGQADVVDAPDGGAHEPARRRGVRGMLADVREGLGYVAGSTWLWVTIAVASLANVGVAPMQVALPKLIHDVYHAGVWLFGGVSAAVSVGSVAATLIIGQMRHPRRRGLLAYSMLLLTDCAVIAFGLPLPRASAPVVALAAGVLFGGGIGAFEIIWVTVMQELVPAEKLGRVSSIDWVGSLALMPAGLALAGVLTDRIGPAAVFVAGGVLMLALNLLALCVPGIRRLE